MQEDVLVRVQTTPRGSISLQIFDVLLAKRGLRQVDLVVVLRKKPVTV